MRLAIDDASGRVNAGGATYFVDIEVLDSAGTDGDWSAATERANAERAAQDPSVIAYVGPGTLEGVRIVAPIAARSGFLVVTPTLTHPALTTKGFDDSLYDAVHPGGATVLLRTIPSDAIAGRAMAKWAISRKLSPSVAAEDTWSKAFAAAIAGAPSGGSAFYYLGGMPATEAVARVRALRGPNASAGVGGAESLLSQAFLDGAAGEAIGVVATFAGRPLETYVGAAGAFARGYRDAYFIDADPYAIFGYDAGRLVLDALERSRQSLTLDRAKVREAAFATKDLDAALGRWSVTREGDTTYDAVQLYVVKALPNGTTAWTWDSEIRP